MVGISTAKACPTQPTRQYERSRKISTATLPKTERHALCARRWNRPRHHSPVGHIRSLGKPGEGPERRRMGQEDELTVSGDFSILPQPDKPLEDKAKAVDSSAEEQPDASQPAAVESSAAAPEAVQGPPAEDKTELAEASSPAAAAAAAAGSRAASEGSNQKAGTSAAVPAAAAKPLVAASGSDAAQVMTAGSAPSVALVYSGSGLGE